MADFDVDSAQKHLKRLERNSRQVRTVILIVSLPLLAAYLTLVAHCLRDSCAPGEWFLTALGPTLFVLGFIFYFFSKRRGKSSE